MINIPKNLGFTLIELILFIVISSLLASTILLALRTGALNAPSLHNQSIAIEAAAQCMDFFIGQKNMNGYSSVATGSSTPAFCTVASGFTISTNVATTTINGDSNYKTITVTVGGAGDAVLTALIGNY